MPGFKTLERGFTVDLHIYTTERGRERIDTICRKYNCSRGAAIDALLDEHEAADLSPHLPPAKGTRKTHRPGQGRRPKKT